jgi:hypothetical protein
MIVSRRTMLAGSGIALGAAVAMPVRIGARAATLHIHDSRLAGVGLACKALATHDIAHEEARLWRASRALTIARGDIVTGETRWSDWVAMRGLLSERGLRERAVALHQTASGTIVAWQMG